MECYKCGAALTGENSCPACGADVKVYKKIIRLSNGFYNQGLARARVRNLSGAVESLLKSLKYYKMNKQARNLLGLVYFEMGETVDALSQWVISRSLMSENNGAEVYLAAVQSNGNKLEAQNQTIKKYNQALLYCRQGSKDLALLQLKKVLNLNPRLIKGHQLLALLYMEEKRYDLAKKSLREASKIDANNAITLRYLGEVILHQNTDQTEKKSSRKEKKDLVSYQSGNETIIHPVDFKDNSALGTILNIVVGVVIGVLITWFLLVPGVKQNAKNDANQLVKEANETIGTKDQTIKTLENQVKELENQVSKAATDNTSTQETIVIYEDLMAAYVLYLQEDIVGAGEFLAKVNTEKLSVAAKNIYDVVSVKVNERYIEQLYTDGEQAYNTQDFIKAAENLQKVADLNEAYKEGDTLYYLAQSYRRLEQNDKAAIYYQKVIEQYPGTQRARNSQTYLNEINNAAVPQ